MAITRDSSNRWIDEHGFPVQVVINNDGTSIGSSGGGGTQYTDGGVAVVNPTGTGIILFDASGNPLIVSDSRPLPTVRRNSSGVEIGTTSNPEVFQGAAANGALVAGNPVRIGVSDGTTTRDLKGETTGAAHVWMENGFNAVDDRISAVLDTASIGNAGTLLTPKFAAIAAATNGANTLVAAVTNKKLRVLALTLVAGAAGNLYFTTAAAGAVIFGGSTNKIVLAVNGGFVLPFSPVGWFETVAGDLLNLNASSTGPFSGGLVYCEV